MHKQLIFSIALMLLTGVSHAVPVTFSGVFDRFNTGPFSGGTSFSGSFTLDESVIATGLNNNFSGVVDNFQLTIGGIDFSGENGIVNQFSSINDDRDFFTLLLGAGTGSGNGSVVNTVVGEHTFNGVSFDWRGANLFDDPTVLAHDLTEEDFDFRRVVFRFRNADGNVDDVIDNNVTSINFGSLTQVPNAGTALLFGIGLLGFAASRRSRKVKLHA